MSRLVLHKDARKGEPAVTKLRNKARYEKLKEKGEAFVIPAFGNRELDRE